MFGVLCGMDKTVVNVLLSSVLPNELGRDIQQNLTGGRLEGEREGGCERGEEGVREGGREGGKKGGRMSGERDKKGRRREMEEGRINCEAFFALLSSQTSRRHCTPALCVRWCSPLQRQYRYQCTVGESCRQPQCHVIATQVVVTFPHTCRPMVGGVCSLSPGYGGEPPGGRRGGTNR